MYKMTYAEIIEGDCRQARADEQQAFNQAIAMMEEAEGKDIAAPEVFAAVQNIQKLWVFLIESLSDPANELAPSLKKDLISIGIWAIREADRVLSSPGKGFAALIEVNRSIRDGLR
jgi:flagellar protein FlaF